MSDTFRRVLFLFLFDLEFGLYNLNLELKKLHFFFFISLLFSLLINNIYNWPIISISSSYEICCILYNWNKFFNISCFTSLSITVDSLQEDNKFNKSIHTCPHLSALVRPRSPSSDLVRPRPPSSALARPRPTSFALVRSR